VARTPRDVTEAELAVLQVLWDRGPATRRQITDILYPGGNPAHYTTVQKLLERLQEKGHVTRQQQASVLTFTATIDREQLSTRRLQHVAEQLCGGSLTPLLMNLVRAGPLTPQELDELQELIRQQGRSGDSGKKKRS
jgi:predicted transcriptional regulator